MCVYKRKIKAISSDAYDNDDEVDDDDDDDDNDDGEKGKTFTLCPHSIVDKIKEGFFTFHFSFSLSFFKLNENRFPSTSYTHTHTHISSSSHPHSPRWDKLYNMWWWAWVICHEFNYNVRSNKIYSSSKASWTYKKYSCHEASTILSCDFNFLISFIASFRVVWKVFLSLTLCEAHYNDDEWIL